MKLTREQVTLLTNVQTLRNCQSLEETVQRLCEEALRKHSAEAEARETVQPLPAANLLPHKRGLEADLKRFGAFTAYGEDKNNASDKK